MALRLEVYHFVAAEGRTSMTQPRKQRFFYCPYCGSKLAYRMINQRQRLKCTACASILYENPIVGVAAIILDHEKCLLLGQRRSGPYQGLWCIPCGYLEYDEDIHTGVKRELKEETNLDIEVGQVYSVQSNRHDPDCYSVGVWYLARIIKGDIQPGDDLCDLGFFPLNNIPPLAFPTDKIVIEQLRREASGPSFCCNGLTK